MTCIRSCLLLAASVSLWGAAPTVSAQSPQQDPMARIRARVEAARLLRALPPPPGVRDVQWKQLSPPGWSPAKIAQRQGVAGLADDEPGAAAIKDEIRSEWDRAPTVPQPDDSPVRLTGYPVMLTEDSAAARTIILAPYYGACIRSPSPPANQMVLVSLKRPLPKNMEQRPIWIVGKMVTLATSTPYGKVAYLMLDAQWEAYPIQKYPMPQYQPLR